QDAGDRLRDREIAGAEQPEDALALALEDEGLLERRDAVDARIGAGIGDEGEAFVDEEADTVAHEAVVDGYCCPGGRSGLAAFLASGAGFSEAALPLGETLTVTSSSSTP